jgi:hypothetical protein
MKKILSFMLTAVVLSYLLIGCKPKVDIEKEKEAIKAVVDGETQAFASKNSTAFKDLYIQDESQTRASLSGSDLSVTEGWSKMKNFADSIPLLDWSQMQDYKFKHDFLAIKVIDNVAWVIFTNSTSAANKGVQYQQKELQEMVLEKNDGKWKISCFVSANIPIPPPPPPPAPVATSEKDKSKK